MKISGRINSHEEPEIPLTLVVHGKRLRKRAIIDTGFNGYLSVPSSLAKGWYFFGHEEYEIATGEIVEQRVYLGKILWGSQEQDVYAVTSRAKDILIGTKLLRRCRLLIDFPRKRLLIR